MNESTEQRFKNHYTEAVSHFLNDIKDVPADAFAGIPEVHLPCWGEKYDESPLRLAFIGIDTNEFGNIDMETFISEAKNDPGSAITRYLQQEVADFRGSLQAYRKWKFMDTMMQFLATLHEIDDWKTLTQDQYAGVRHSFVWANANAVVRWPVARKIKGGGADYDTWQRLKNASEKHLDSLSAILNVFRPRVVIVMNWKHVPSGFWTNIPQREKIADHVLHVCAHNDSHATHVFQTTHPRWLIGKRRESVFKTICEKLQTDVQGHMTTA